MATPAPLTVGTAGAALPRRAGAGFKPRHFAQWLADPAPPAFAEVHAENHLAAGGASRAMLDRLAARVPLSIHGVGLSIGGATLDDVHLARIAALLDRFPDAPFSEHLAWSTHDGTYFNDLLPVAYDRPTLDRVCLHVDRVQARLRRRIALENPSTYVTPASSDWDEPDFLAAIVARTGCALLLDVNNLHVSCHNHGRDPLAYLAALPLAAVTELHLAGFAEDRGVSDDEPLLLIDTHGAPVAPAVWGLYREVLARVGALPTLVEWDTDVPDYATLRAEAARADACLDAAAGATC